MSSWVTLPLSELAEIRVSNVDKKSRLEEKSVQLCNYMDVYSNEYIDVNIEFMQSTANSVEREKFKVCSGDVIITKDSETPFDIGIPAVVIDDIHKLVCGYHLALIKPNREKVDSVYLSKQLASNDVARYFSRMAAGSTRYGLSNGAIAAVVIPLAPKEQQLKIAAILSTIDQAIEKTEALIHKYQQIKAGLMHDLFTRGLTADGKLRPPREQAPELYHETPIGWIPKEWETKKLGELVHFQRGHDIVESEFIEGTYPVVSSGGVIGYHNRFTTKAPNVVVGRKGTIGKVHFLEVDFWAHDTSLYATDFFSNEPLFIFYLCFWLDLSRFGTRSGSPSLNRNDIHPLDIACPQPEEQKQINMRLVSCDEKIKTLNGDFKKLSKQKSGLMHDLLTGKVPVTIDPEETEHGS